jgi:RNA recognition motif-containing protein
MHNEIAKHFPWSHETLSQYILYFSQLPRETTSESFREYLSQFGEVAWIEVFKKPRCRDAFAHVLFEKKESYELVFQTAMHVFCHQKLRCSMWKRTAWNSCFEDILNARKIFIKNLSNKYDEMDMFKYFKQFGTIENIEMPVSHHNNRKRHIAFIVFRTESAVENCLREKAHIKKETNFRVRAYQAEDPLSDDEQKPCFSPSAQPKLAEIKDKLLIGPVPDIQLIKKQQNPEEKTLFFETREVPMVNCIEEESTVKFAPTKINHNFQVGQGQYSGALCLFQSSTIESSALDQNSTQTSLLRTNSAIEKPNTSSVRNSMLDEPFPKHKLEPFTLERTAPYFPSELAWDCHYLRSYSISYFTVPGGI